MDLETQIDHAIALYRQGALAAAESAAARIVEQAQDNAKAHHLLGVIRLRQHRAEEALVCFDRALQILPAYPEALSNRAAVLLELARLPEAVESCQKALALRPRYGSALNNLGNALRRLKQLDAALTVFDRALMLSPDSGEAGFNRALALHDLGRFPEAVADFDRAIAIDPSDVLALFHRSATLHRAGRLPEALAGYDRVLALHPDFLEAWNGRGTVQLALRRFADALYSFDRLLSAEPHHAEALSNRGAALAEMGRAEEALSALDKADAAASANPQILFNRGAVLQRLGRLEEALASYDAALAIDPGNAGSWNNRAGTLRDLGRLDAALASYDRAVAVQPDHAEAWCNRGSVLRELKRSDEALRSYDRALAINPGLTSALSSRANLLWVTYRDHEKALRDLERAIATDPDYPYLRGDLLHLRMFAADWRNFDAEVAALDKGVREGRRVVSPFIYQVVSSPPADLKACAALYARDRFPAAAAVFSRPAPHSKIRIGYVSGEFRQQATSFLTAGLYERHDRARFEITAFDSGRDDGSAMRKRLEAAFDKFADISALSDQAAAARIAAENIDILVNLNGYFGEARMGVFAQRPAPLQVNYLGFPGTLGADYIDYLIADHIVIPEAEAGHYTEAVVYLPDSYQVNDSARPIGAQAPSREDCGLPGSGFVFCNFNQNYKLTPAMFAAWMRILGQAGGSVLWLLEGSPAYSRRLRQEAERGGIAGERLIFAPLAPAEQHLARHRNADLFLDSLPCNAHTTASDALWAGLPVVTCRGTAFAGRVAASLLFAIGLPELVTDDLARYEALCVKLARDPPALQSIRTKIRENRLTAPLFDTDRYRRNIEAAYAAMWDRHLRGAPPRGFSV